MFMFNEVILPGSLALRFNIGLTGSHANNFLVQNVSRALVDKIAVKYKSANQPDASCYDIYKIFEDLFLSLQVRENNMLPEGIQTNSLGRQRQRKRKWMLKKLLTPFWVTTTTPGWTTLF